MVQKERRRADLQMASVTRSGQAHVVYHAHHAVLLPCQSLEGRLDSFASGIQPNRRRWLMPLACH
jgi:hypothetical protein